MGVRNTSYQVEQVKRYIKIPDRRLISGLLHVSVVNHDANDAQDDFVQQCYDKRASVSPTIKYSNSFTKSGESTFADGNQGFLDRGRDGMKHSFADYDCFLFYVAGGMSLSGGIQTYGSPISGVSGGSNLVSNSFATNEGGGTYRWAEAPNDLLTPADISANWFLGTGSGYDVDPIGDFCSHFVKYHLISRINNASGHGQLNFAQGTPMFYKTKPIQRRTYTVGGSAIDARDANYADTSTHTAENILSHGMYDTKDTLGNDLGRPSYAQHSSGASSGNFVKIAETSAGSDGQWVSDGAGGLTYATSNEGNTYFSPVDGIKIYGSHRFQTVGRQRNDGRKIYSITGNGAYHEQNFWSLVIDVGLRGNNSSGSSSEGSSDKAIMRNQVNVSFQPFGETGDFDVSDTMQS